MWKKLENFASSRPDSNPNEVTNSNEGPENNLESMNDAWLMSIVKGHEQEFEGVATPAEAPPAQNLAQQQSFAQNDVPQTQRQQESPLTLGAYTEAVNKFTKSASAFIEHLPLLAEARQAYEEATRASTELRRVLDAGDENLRKLMAHLEQMANIQLVNVPGAKAGSEPSRLGPIRVGEEIKGGMKRFP